MNQNKIKMKSRLNKIKEFKIYHDYMNHNFRHIFNKDDKVIIKRVIHKPHKTIVKGFYQISGNKTTLSVFHKTQAKRNNDE